MISQQPQIKHFANQSKMRLTQLFITFVFPLLALADWHTVKADIGNITTLLNTLGEHAQEMKSGMAGVPIALQVQVDAVKLDKVIREGTQHAKDSDPFGGQGSLQVGLALVALKPKIISTLDDMAKQQETFGDFGIFVLQSLRQLEKDTDAFAAAVTEKLSGLEKSIAPGIIKSIDGAFDKAVKKYESTGEFSDLSSESMG